MVPAQGHVGDHDPAGALLVVTLLFPVRKVADVNQRSLVLLEPDAVTHLLLPIVVRVTMDGKGVSGIGENHGNPLLFLHGLHRILPSFSAAVRGVTHHKFGWNIDFLDHRTFHVVGWIDDKAPHEYGEKETKQ